MEYPFKLKNGTLWQEKPAQWSLLIRYLKEYAVDKKASVYIPVTKSSFDNYYSISKNKNPFLRRCDGLIQDFIEKGYLFADAQIESNIIRVSSKNN